MPENEPGPREEMGLLNLGPGERESMLLGLATGQRGGMGPGGPDTELSLFAGRAQGLQGVAGRGPVQRLQRGV